jgi:hypothetical protein
MPTAPEASGAEDGYVLHDGSLVGSGGGISSGAKKALQLTCWPRPYYGLTGERSWQAIVPDVVLWLAGGAAAPPASRAARPTAASAPLPCPPDTHLMRGPLARNDDSDKSDRVVPFP